MDEPAAEPVATAGDERGQSAEVEQVRPVSAVDVPSFSAPDLTTNRPLSVELPRVPLHVPSRPFSLAQLTQDMLASSQHRRNPSYAQVGEIAPRAAGGGATVFQPSTYLTNRRRKRPAALVVCAVLAVGAATAAVSTASAGSADERGTSITLTLPQEPESWNYWEVGANALRVPTFYNVQETLLENLPDGTTVPMLAEAYEVSEDGLTVTFHIREAKFHDGTDLDAADVVYSLNKNAESPLSKLSAVYSNVASVEATDDRTVVVTLTNPSASFIQEMGMSAGYIVPEGAHENYDLDTGDDRHGPLRVRGVPAGHQPDDDAVRRLLGRAALLREHRLAVRRRRDRGAQRAGSRRVRRRGRRRRRGDRPGPGLRGEPRLPGRPGQRRGVVHVPQRQQARVPGRPRTPGDRPRDRPSAVHRCGPRRLWRPDLPDGGAAQRAVQQRLLPVPVRSGTVDGSCSRRPACPT